MRSIIWTVILIGLGVAAKAQDNSNNVLSSAAEFLRMSPDARTSSLGNTGIAFAQDMSALHYNSASIVFAEADMEAGVTYTSWLKSMGVEDVFFGYLGGYKKFRKTQMAGVQLKYFSLGNVTYKDSYGVVMNNSQPKEFELSTSYARKLGKMFSVGVTPKYIHSSMGSGMQYNGYTLQAAHAFAVDVSMAMAMDLSDKSRLNGGLTISNMGSKIRYADGAEANYLPANLGFGVGYSMVLKEGHQFRVGTDINKLLVPTPVGATYIDSNGQLVSNATFDSDNNGVADFKEHGVIKAMVVSLGDGASGEEWKEVEWSVGAEYLFKDVVSLRAGYHNEAMVKGGRKYLSTGFGIHYKSVRFNFSYWINTGQMSASPMDNTLRFSMIYSLLK